MQEREPFKADKTSSAPRVMLIALCAALATPSATAAAPADQLGLLGRLTWGVNETSAQDLAATGRNAWIERQITASSPSLPADAQAQIDAMRISREPLAQLVVEMDAESKTANAIPDPDQKKAARDAYNKDT